MEKSDILGKLEQSKERLEKLEKQIRKIEEAEAYKDFEKFDFWKKNISRNLSLINEAIQFSEIDLERTLALVDRGWYGQSAAERYAEEDMDRVVAKVTEKFREINRMLKEAVS